MPDLAPDFLHRAYVFYTALGYTPEQASAMAAHAGVESNGNPTVQGDGGKALGIYQWHPDRQAELQKFAKDHNLDPLAENTQLGFADWELHNTEKSAGNKLFDSKSLTGANDAVLDYLRPAGYSPKDAGVPSYGNRLDIAAQVLNQFSDPTNPGGMGGAVMPPATAGGPPAPADPNTINIAGGSTAAPGDILSNPAAAKPFNYGGLASSGLGLMQAGQPQQDWAQKAMQQGPGAGMPQAQAHRPQMQGGGGMPQMGMPAGGNPMQAQLAGLLSDPSMDPQKKQMLMGLLGS